MSVLLAELILNAQYDSIVQCSVCECLGLFRDLASSWLPLLFSVISEGDKGGLLSRRQSENDAVAPSRSPVSTRTLAVQVVG